MNTRPTPVTPDENEGEGSRSAARRYNDGVERFVQSHDVEQLARDARREVEQDPEGFRAAEQEGKGRAAPQRDE